MSLILSILSISSNLPPPTDIYTISLHDALPIFLPDAHGFDDDLRVAGRVEDCDCIDSRSGETAEISAGGHLANKNAFVQADRKSTRLNSSNSSISYAVFCLKKKKHKKKFSINIS